MKELKDFTDEEALQYMMEEEKKSEMEGNARWARMTEQQRLFFRIVAFNFNQYSNYPSTVISFEKQGFSEEEAFEKADEYYYNWYVKEFGSENLKYYYRMPERYRKGIHKDLVFDDAIRRFNYKEL